MMASKLGSGYSSELGEGGEISPGRDHEDWGTDDVLFLTDVYTRYGTKRKMPLHLSCVLLYRHCISQLKKLMEWVRMRREKRGSNELYDRDANLVNCMHHNLRDSC